MLLRVLCCRTCGSPMYGLKAHSRNTGRYRCIKCGYYVAMEKLERFTEESLLRQSVTASSSAASSFPVTTIRPLFTP